MNKVTDNIAEELLSLDYRQISGFDLNLTGGASLSYYENSQISRASVLRNRIFGRVGNFLEQFDVNVAVHGQEISSQCSCGQGRKFCKHAIVLLYGWVNDRDDFLDIGVVLRDIKTYDSEKLVAIIGTILKFYPQLVHLVLAKSTAEWDEIELDPIL